MISTHWRTPHHSADREFQLLDVLARQAADLIERTHSEEVLRASERALQEADRRKDEFLGIASHELKTPLTSAKANVQIIARRLSRMLDSAPTDAAAMLEQLQPLQHLLESSVGALDRLGRLVTDLLDISRIQAGRLEMRPERIDLVTTVRNAVAEEAQAWPDREVRLTGLLRNVGDVESAVAPSVSLTVVADPDRIAEVVINFLSNAFKYAPADHPITIRLDAAEGETHGVRVSVQDQGPGLSPEQQQNVFERFYRADGIDNQHGSDIGLGLGLFICQEIITRHGGQVGVVSTVGKGSTFWFTLPAAAALASEEAPLLA